MSIHQYNKNALPDSGFTPGSINLLVPGNELRLLDNRRTPGVIKQFFHESAMFQWEITDFEDKGKHWEIPAEEVINYQFTKGSASLKETEVTLIERKIKQFQKKLTIKANQQDLKITLSEIQALKSSISDWLSNNSIFFKRNLKLDFDPATGSKCLTQDLIRYMKDQHLEHLEQRTADTIVMNPFSGEWMKGMSVVFAEMGLVDYHAKIPRTKDIFTGDGSKIIRRNYILHRLAFIRAYFELLDISEIILFRGMNSTKEWKPVRQRWLVSFTFNKKVAESFANFGKPKESEHSYLLKRTIPVEKLFMSYLETEAMNRQYKEAEALVFYDSKDAVLW